MRAGNEKGGIDVAAWMVTDTAEHLVRQGVVEASLDPTVMRVRRPATGEVLPELSYKVANEYGVPVHRAAEPVFPVDFMIVSQSHGFATVPARFGGAFPVENRGVGGVSTSAARALVNATDVRDFCRMIADFHALVFIATAGVLSESAFCLVARVVGGDDAAAVQELWRDESWNTLKAIVNESAAAGPVGGGSGDRGGAPRAEWACRHCTFVNQDSEICEMCGLPNE